MDTRSEIAFPQKSSVTNLRLVSGHDGDMEIATRSLSGRAGLPFLIDHVHRRSHF